MPRDMIETEAPQSVDEKALLRARWLAELRRQGHRQCVGQQFTYDGGACAVRLLFEMLSEEQKEAGGNSIVKAGALATGMTFEQASVVLMLNDGRREWWVDGIDVRLPERFARRSHTFAEIADTVEGWFR